MWAKSQDTVHKSQFLKRKESRRGSNRGPSTYQPSALPLGHTGSPLLWLCCDLRIPALCISAYPTHLAPLPYCLTHPICPYQPLPFYLPTPPCVSCSGLAVTCIPTLCTLYLCLPHTPRPFTFLPNSPYLPFFTPLAGAPTNPCLSIYLLHPACPTLALL